LWWCTSNVVCQKALTGLIVYYMIHKSIDDSIPLFGDWVSHAVNSVRNEFPPVAETYSRS
jgi:hypothetical protein